MDTKFLAGELISMANAITAFAILQNIALCYLLVKRELKFRLHGTFQWVVIGTAVLWNGTYVWMIWWCSISAQELSAPSLTGAAARTIMLVTAGKSIAAAIFGAMSVLLLLVYNHRPFWLDSVPSASSAKVKAGTRKR